VGHAAEVSLITPEDIGEASREVGHSATLPLTVAFPQPLRACESAMYKSSLLRLFLPRLGLRSRGALFLVAQHVHCARPADGADDRASSALPRTFSKAIIAN
jgi:hypothetical protein